MAKEQAVDKVVTTRRFLDKRRNPWEYVDEELPTTTRKIFSRGKQGTIIDSNSGITNMGSIEFSGSHYDFGPGSYSMRVIRRSVHIGSAQAQLNYEWKIRHSREGTVDMIPFYKGTLDRSHELLGGPMRPIYSFGPGTIWTYFHPRKGTARVYSSLEVIF